MLVILFAALNHADMYGFLATRALPTAVFGSGATTLPRCRRPCTPGCPLSAAVPDDTQGWWRRAATSRRTRWLNSARACSWRKPARLPPYRAAARRSVVGAGPDVLVVENSDTYWVVLDALRGVDGHRVGVVAWGSGRSFPSQVESLGVDVAGRGPVRGTTWYGGDYEPIGIEIAIAASRASDAIAVEPGSRPVGRDGRCRSSRSR